MTYVIRIFLVFIFFPLVLFAQNAPVDSLQRLTVSRLQEVVIQATRAGDKGPVPHNNLGADLIAQKLQAQDVPMLLSALPSLVESSDAGIGIGYTSLRIRGSDPSRVNVTINGVPFNDAESQLVYWVDLPDLAASAAEIQVQRGVGVSSNGAGAFGATVNLDLSKVSAQPAASVTSTIGAFGTTKFSAAANTGLLSSKWSFAGRASRIHSDGFIDRAATDLQSVHLSAAYLGERQTWQAHFLSGHENTYQAWNGVPAQYIDNEALRSFNTAGTERPGAPHPDEVDDYLQQHVLLHYKFNITPHLLLQLNGHYTQGRGYYEQYKADQPYAQYGLLPWEVNDSLIEVTDLIRQRWLDNHFFGGTFVLRWVKNQSNSWMLGGAMSQYTGRHFGKIIWSEFPTGQANDFTYYDNDAVKHDANVYLKLEKRLFPRLTGFADLQVRGIQYRFLGYNQALESTNQTVQHTFFNPKLGATYSFSNHWTAYSFWGIGHREPNRDDYTQSSPNSRPKAESMTDTELGLRFETAGYAATLNAYYMAYKNQLVLDGRLNDVGAYIRTNVPDSYRAGIELELKANLAPRVALGGSLAVSQNKVKRFGEYRDVWDDNSSVLIEYKQTSLAYSPAIVSQLNANFILLKLNRRPKSASGAASTGGLAFDISGKFVGKQYLDNTSNEQAVLPAYFFSDLRLNFDCPDLIGSKLSIILSLNNWLDAKYASNGWVYRFVSSNYDPRPDDPYTRLESSNVYHQAGFFPQAGRHWMATARVEF